jgi:hypothetical protein
VLDPVCAAPECRRRFPLVWHQQKQGPEYLAWRQRMAEAEARCRAAAEAEARCRAAAETEARRLLGEPADAGGDPDPSALPLAVITAWEPPRIANLPERRRRAFRDYLTDLLSQATAGSGGPPPAGEGADAPRGAAPELQAVLGQVCAFCRGRCCQNGGDQAYLTADTLLRYLAANPGRRPRDVLADYLGRVGAKTYRGSCVYHGPRGCGLPPEMRSDTCNRFYCRGLERFRAAVGGAAPARAAVVAHVDGVVRAVAVVGGGATRVVRLPMARPEDPRPRPDGTKGCTPGRREVPGGRRVATDFH